jgi:hypothetical protein
MSQKGLKGGLQHNPNPTTPSSTTPSLNCMVSAKQIVGAAMKNSGGKTGLKGKRGPECLIFHQLDGQRKDFLHSEA